METLKIQVENTLRTIFSEEKERYKDHPLETECLQALEQFVLGDGKRLRPLSVLAFYLGSGGKLEGREDVMRVACAMEMIHNATLVHDDVIDEDETRRNSPTIVKTFFDKYKQENEDISTNKFLFLSRGATYSTGISIMLGNILGTIPLRLCIECDNQIGKYAMDMYNEINFGQVLDLTHLNTFDGYLQMIQKKTVIFFETTAKIGLTLAKRNESEIRKGIEWGKHFGIAFQMRDDLLDIDIHNGKLRKIGSDIKEGKKTSVVLKALEDGVLSSEENAFMKNALLLNERLFEDTVVFERFLTVLRGKPSELIRELINHHYQLAIHALEELHQAKMKSKKSNLQLFMNFV